MHVIFWRIESNYRVFEQKSLCQKESYLKGTINRTYFEKMRKEDKKAKWKKCY